MIVKVFVRLREGEMGRKRTGRGRKREINRAIETNTERERDKERKGNSRQS